MPTGAPGGHFTARPHWGKHHWYGPDELARRYPEWDTFQAVSRAFDPEGVFLNDHLARVFEGGGGDAGDTSASVAVGAGSD